MKEKYLTTLCLISMCTYNFLLHHSYKGLEFATLAVSSLKTASIQSSLPSKQASICLWTLENFLQAIGNHKNL